MSSKWISIQNILASEEERQQKKVDPKNDQPDLKPDHDQKDQSATMQPGFIETTLHRNGFIETSDHRNQPSMKQEIIEVKDHRSEISMKPQTIEKGYFLPNWIQDELIPTLEIVEQSVFLRIVRLTLGFNRQITDSVSFNKLSEKCNLSVPAIQKAIKSLQQKRLLKVHSDLSRSKLGGNKYELGEGFYETTLHRNETSMKPKTNTKDLDLDLKNHKSSQAEVETIYQTLTGNTWTKSDSTTYKKISHLSVMEFTQLIKSTLEKAHQKPISLAYFVKAYQNPTQANPANKSAIKAKLAAIVQRKQEAHVGAKYTISDLTFDVKAECVREGIAFDNDLFSEIIDGK